MEQLIFEHLKDRGIIASIEKDYGQISLKISDKGIAITGNRLELIMLADYILNAALADFDGWHIHLDNKNFFDNADRGLTVELNLSKGD